ncbi:MAG: glycosyltransferase family A protein [Clostridiales bacterium]|nr:glycosyltransferase family A protein [Clostridiales bacterium]
MENYLKNIRSQTYPRDKVEIVVAWGAKERIDDLQEKYDCRVIYDDTPDLEARRRIAAEHATGEWIFMASDDNFFPNPHLFEEMMDAVLTEHANAAECVWQYYDRKDYPINRYCALVGVYDPSVYYLRRQDHMQVCDRKWNLIGTVLKETDKYFKVKIKKDEVPTMGDQGILIRRKDVLIGNSGEALLHMDMCAELIENGRDEFIFMKDYFGHDCVRTKKQLLGKLKRNVDRFQEDGSSRKMNYEMSGKKMVMLGLTLGTFVIPLKDAIVGFCKIHDWAWFIHPVLCFQVACLYTWSTVKAKLKKSKS